MTTNTDINELARRMHEHADDILGMEQDYKEDGYQRKELIEAYDKADSLFGAKNILLILNVLEAAQKRIAELEQQKQQWVGWAEQLGTKADTEQKRIAELEASQPVVPEWRVINSRHPAHHADVLIYCTESDEQMVGYRFSDTEFAYAVDESGTVIVCEPSHWMPTPAAPALQEG